MRIYKYLTRAVMLAVSAMALTLAVPFVVSAQESSINTYSPYTLYGIGNLNSASNSAFVGMGGASIGYRNAGFDTPMDTRLNVSNPASLSGLLPRNFIFDVGLAGSNVYLMQRDVAAGSDVIFTRKTSFNTFNFNNITAAMPIARNLGLAVNVSPFSEVGYRIHTDDVSHLADLGIVRYFYNGEGDITEAKASMGWAPFKRLSIGADLIYLWGNINRTYEAVILDYTGQGSYGEVSSQAGSSASTKERVSRIMGGFGVQYSAIEKAKTRLTLGATYRLGGKLNSTITDFIPSNNVYGDTIRFNQMRSVLYLPQKIGVGAYLHRPKWALGADWVYENWARNGYDAANDVRYVNTNTVKVGVQYTPNRYDIRGKGASFFNRITYKAGFRYGKHYMEFGGRKINEKVITLGFDIPFDAMKVSKLSLGLELGERGALKNRLVRERFIQIRAGVMLFGRDNDYWFEKYKYN